MWVCLTNACKQMVYSYRNSRECLFFWIRLFLIHTFGLWEHEHCFHQITRASFEVRLGNRGTSCCSKAYRFFQHGNPTSIRVDRWSNSSSAPCSQSTVHPSLHLSCSCPSSSPPVPSVCYLRCVCHANVIHPWLHVSVHLPCTGHPSTIPLFPSLRSPLDLPP